MTDLILAGYEIKETTKFHFDGKQYDSRLAARHATLIKWLMANSGMCSKCAVEAAAAMMGAPDEIRILLGRAAP